MISDFGPKKRVVLAILESPGRNRKLIKLLCTMCIIPIL